MIKVGLEKEFFVSDKEGNLIIVDTKIYPFDECGILVEARGDAFSNIVDAVFSLKASIFRVYKLAKENNNLIIDSPFMKIPRALKLEAARNFAKGVISYQNLYGYEAHKLAANEHSAGIHISFTNQRTVKRIEYNGIFDYPKIFRKLDIAFKQEIKEAKRRPGFYEIKPDGRVEYRSLPSTASLTKIIEVLNDGELQNE